MRRKPPQPFRLGGVSEREPLSSYAQPSYSREAAPSGNTPSFLFQPHGCQQRPPRKSRSHRKIGQGQAGGEGQKGRTGGGSPKCRPSPLAPRKPMACVERLRGPHGQRGIAVRGRKPRWDQNRGGPVPQAQPDEADSRRRRICPKGGPAPARTKRACGNRRGQSRRPRGRRP